MTKCSKCGSEMDADIVLNDCFGNGPGEDCDVCPHWDCCDKAGDERGHEEKVDGEKSCESCYWNDDDGPYAGCIISRGRTGRDLCTRLGGNVDRWIGWPEVEKP